MDKLKTDFVLRQLEENKNKVVFFRVTIAGEHYYYTFNDSARIMKYLLLDDRLRYFNYNDVLECSYYVQQEEILNVIEKLSNGGIKSVIIEATSVFNHKPSSK